LGVTIAMRSRSWKRLCYSQNDTVNVKTPPFLSEDLIVEILIRLPVRLLLQYKCVCKSWKTLIYDPQFVKCQLLSSNAHPQLVSVFFGVSNNLLESYPLKPLLDNPSTNVEPAIFEMRYATSMIGSCNGLLCLHDYSRFTFKL